MTILNNIDISFDYHTLINDPNVNNSGTNGEYDFENANIILNYKIPKEDRYFDWITGYGFERIDNDNDFVTGFSFSEGSKKVNKLLIRTIFGQFGYQEGEEIDTFTGNTKSINNFFYKVYGDKKYYLGNNTLLKPKFEILFDSDSDGYIKVALDIKKFFGNSNNFIGIGNQISYNLNLDNSNPTDIESYLVNSIYLEGFTNKFTGTVSYDIGKIKFKGPNVETTENPQGLYFRLGRYDIPINPLNTEMQIGWQ